jgi:Zn-finger nucleic acid-binding protein
VEVEGLKVEICSTCKGMFLDPGELNELAGDSSGDFEYCTAIDDRLDTEDLEGEARCPKCEDRPVMRKVEFNSLTDIVLDYCDGCGGLWLDQGELEQIRTHAHHLSEVKLPFWFRLQQIAMRLPF